MILSKPKINCFKSKKWLFLAITVVIYSFFQVTHAQAQTASSQEGWESIISNNNSCASGQAEREFVFKDKASKKRINPAEILNVDVLVLKKNSKSYTVKRKQSFGSVNITPAICFDPKNERLMPRVTFVNGSSYESFNAVSYHLQKKFLFFKSWPEIGRHIRYEIYVGKSTENKPTIQILSPLNKIIKNNQPRLRARVNKIDRIYGSGSILVSTFWLNGDQLAFDGGVVKNIIERGFLSLLFNWGNGPGVRSYKTPTLSDGLYYWWYNAQGNGKKTIIKSGYSIKIRAVPGTTVPDASPFLVDTIPPSSSITATIGSVQGKYADVVLDNQVKDTGSGLSNTVIYVKATDNSFSATVPHSFTVGQGIVGGPKGVQKVTVPFNLMSGKTYNYYAVTTDAAGNKKTTNTQTFTLPSVPWVSVTANPVQILPGGSTDITWSVNKVTNCIASSNPVTSWSGQRIASQAGGPEPVTNILQDTIFTLVCDDPNGNQISDNAIVYVGSLQPTITVDKPLVKPGDPVVITWDPGISQATGCNLSSNITGNANVAGSDIDNPSNFTTYTINCPYGSASVTVSTISVLQET